MTFVSYAQNFEDVLLWRALGHIDKGFYIDLGASDPDIDSVTRAFYERGWSGINVEPVTEQFRRLTGSRLRDINLRVAVSDVPGTAGLFVMRGTGLSTLDRGLAESYRAQGLRQETIDVPVDTLAAICHRHVRSDIHFLKIDVEGSERAALSGANFDMFRPWIVLVEATQPTTMVESYADWEGILTAAGYVFVWFDGLNRFYVARERHDALALHFRTPPNVFDDFVRVADNAGASRIDAAEARNEALLKQVADAQARLGSARTEVALLNRKLADAIMRGDAAADWAKAMRASTSWHVTAPLRRVMSFAARLRSGPAPVTHAAAVETAPASPMGAGLGGMAAPGQTVAILKRSIHQFHSGSAKGDAITNAMLLCRDLLRGLGYRSEIFVEWPDVALGEEVRPWTELPRHGDYVLIVRHSAGYAVFDRIRALPATKVLIYHNITPPELLHENQRQFSRLGRDQLAQWRGHVAAALADSEFNAIELRALGFEEARACMLLFDLNAMQARAAAARTQRGMPAQDDVSAKVFTILFVGRVTPSKGQDHLIEAFAIFRERFGSPCRLVLVGRQEAASDAYLQALRSRIGSAGLNDQVILTGLISDAARDDWFARADLYVSLSHHEGFGVPLVEAVAHGLPVLAIAAGAVPYTLCEEPGDEGAVNGALLADRSPATVAAAMLALALDPAGRAAFAERQHRLLDRFRLDRQLPKLLHALALAGAAPPADPDSRVLLAANLHFTVAGHVNGSYSLAVVNRTLAAALEASCPGRVQLAPVEGRPTKDISGVPPADLPVLSRLADRPPPASGPHVVISQHFPLFTRSPPGDAMLALFFWEESLIPGATLATLDSGFRGVLAPSHFVAKALIDSGLSTPVHVVGYAPVLAGFHELGDLRGTGGRARQPGAPFTFLHVSSCFPRKGVDVLLTAYAKAFSRGDQVRLVIKGFPNPHNDVAQQIAALRQQNAELAEITYIEADISRAEMLLLYRDADAMVLPTRGEGFNIAAAEAMAAGLALVVTGGGGHMDFCNADTAGLIDFRFAPSRSHLSTPLSLWMEPDPDDLARKMRGLADDRAPGGATARRTERARRAASGVADQAAWAQRVSDAALDILLAPPRAAIRIAWVSTWAERCGVAEYSGDLLDAMPATPAIAGITVLCDTRASASAPAKGIRVRPAWRIGASESMAGLAAAIAQEDADIVVVQHQPGLIGWGALGELLEMPALTRRLVVVTLHTTRQLLDAEVPQREAAIKALTGIARVLVHTPEDLNFLKSQGLTANVTLMPHGTRPPVRPQAARPLTPASTPLIGCYGFFLKGKGIPQLIAAMTVIRTRFANARLRLVNADYGSADSAAEIAACRRAAALAGLEDAIEFHTEFLSHAESLELLAACDVVALPYQASRESSSAALRTALRAGVPVAVTPLALFDEAGDAVARLPGLDSAALAEGLAALLADAPTRMDIQVAAQIWLAERDCGKVAVRLQGMLLGLTASPPGSTGPRYRCNG